ncbi:Ankyrin repeat family protein [Mycena sanguinolenta]|uniref:Ankyrin repeat family protein n=1 Tax=Mycena sanguinolenta TaxID=230812 RepID=A0A8H6Y213_9AGAR|nr:Ankyrin repeat family protein [Mycena sanguinolenta]
MEASDAIVDLNTLTLHAKVKRHREHPRVINIISVQVKHPQFGDLVSLEAWRIFRAHCADSFLEIMDEDIDEMHQFSVTLFDKYGNLRPHLMSPGYRSGTGCWGQEVNSGQLLYILDMTVEEPYRGKGIGTWTLQQFLRTEHVQNDDTVICWPNPMGICDKALWDIEKKRQIGFFRKSDFRRIGRTNFFGYSPKRDHPSRSIPLEGDAGALDDNFSVTSTNVQLQFPLHFAIISDKTTNVASTIQSFYDQDPTSIHRADDMGFTPILVAVSSQNLIATRKLLEWDLRADLENAVNAEGVTPLEQLANVMRSGREFSEIFLGWQGYSDDELTMQYLLKQGMGQAVGLNLADYISKKKYGCTCDKCARGWLSPRMRFALRTDAQFWADSMPMNFDFFTKGRAADPSIMMDSPSSFIPPALYPNFYLTFYKGYCEVLTAISALLGTTDEVLSVEGVLRFINPDQNSQYFFQKGGRIEYAFDSITHCAKEQSSLGDDTFRETFGDHEDWVSLPTCANDLEFQLVRKMIGLDGRGQRWGAIPRQWV